MTHSPNDTNYIMRAKKSTVSKRSRNQDRVIEFLLKMAGAITRLHSERKRLINERDVWQTRCRDLEYELYLSR